MVSVQKNLSIATILPTGFAVSFHTDFSRTYGSIVCLHNLSKDVVMEKLSKRGILTAINPDFRIKFIICGE